MTPLWFFIAGLPVAYFIDQAITNLSAPQAEDDDEDLAEAGAVGPDVQALPWQTGRWPRFVSLSLAGAAPPLMALAGARFGIAEAIAVSGLLVALLICTGTDLIRFRVPNVVTYSATILALLAAIVFPDGDPVKAVLSAGVAAFVFLLISIFTRGGLGLGDVKLAMLIGAALGFPGAYHALFLGVFCGGIVITGLFIAGVVSRKQAVPYAPFLAAAAMAVTLIKGTAFAVL